MEHCSKTLIAFVVIFLTANLIFLIWQSNTIANQSNTISNQSNTIANLRHQNNMQCTTTTTTTEGLSKGIKVEKNCTRVIPPNCPKLNGKQALAIFLESKTEN